MGVEITGVKAIPDVPIPLLMYADDLTLLSSSSDGLKKMLLAMDTMTLKYGLRINASKTKVMSIGKYSPADNHGVHPLAHIHLSGGPVQIVHEFKYLGGLLSSDGSMDAEIAARQRKALYAFKQLAGVWCNPHLSLAHKSQIYKTFIIPHFLYGAETWNSTLQQESVLERAHTSCLRVILGVTKHDRHSNLHVRKACKVQSLGALLTASRLRWLGHVARMDDERYPKAALFGEMPGRIGRGRPFTRFSDVAKRAIHAAGMSCQSWMDTAHYRQTWRGKIQAYLKKDSSGEPGKHRPPSRRQPFRNCKIISWT